MTRAKTRLQQGAALVVGLIMLVFVTLMLVAALNLGTTNFRAVSNTQFRQEAIDAANVAIQQVLSSPFANEPAEDEVLVDINGDDSPDYTVNVAEPECIFAEQAFGADPSSLSLPASMTVSSTWNTVWDLDATVDPDSNAGGAAVRVRAGARVLLPESKKDEVCP